MDTSSVAKKADTPMQKLKPSVDKVHEMPLFLLHSIQLFRYKEESASPSQGMTEFYQAAMHA